MSTQSPLLNPEPLPRAAYVMLEGRMLDATVLTRGPWSAEHQHAGPPIAMVCRALEAQAAQHDLGHIARLTANLLRPVPITKMEIEVTTDYAGRNAAHYSARLVAQGKEVARFTALAQREVELSLPEQMQGHPLEQAPKGPDSCVTERMPARSEINGYADLVETRVARGRMFRGASAVWFRLRRPLIEDEAPSPYQRVAVAADSGNGISALLDIDSYSFVNSDLTINLLRRPLGEWICIDARTLLAPNGCGLAESQIFDEVGFIGRATQSLAVRSRE